MTSGCTKTTDLLLQWYLERTLPDPLHNEVKSHLDTCPNCRDRWNRFRWERARGTRGYAEFLSYLHKRGEPLLEYLDSSQELIAEWQRLAPQTLEEREAFFRRTPYYLYNLLIWHESTHRPPYVALAEPVLRQLQAHVICDFGCGIGSDGLQFLEYGYRVVFCEFDNPSSRFLRWRLQQRHLKASWLEPSEIQHLSDVDTLWAIDVFDHLPDIQALIPLLERCRLVCFENDSYQKSHGGSSFHIQHAPQVIHSLLSAYHFKKKANTSHLISIWQKERDDQV